MPPFNFGQINFDVGGDTSQTRRDPDTPFRLLLLGDFSGRSGREKALSARKPVVVDRDNFDEVLAAFHPELRLNLGNEEFATLQFSELDDFHPDRLLERVDLFRKLRELRTLADDPEAFDGAAKELSMSGRPSQVHEAQPSAATAVSLASGSLLDEMIEQTEASVQKRAPAEDELQKFVRRITKPHLVSSTEPRQAEAHTLVELALGAEMRALLHVPEFQALEAAWRAVFLLVRRIDTDEMLKIYLVDVSEDELRADMKSSPDLRSTWTYRLLVERATSVSGSEPWAAVVGNYRFGPSAADAELLGCLAKIAHAAGAPFLAAASPELLGCESFSTNPDARDWKLPTDDHDASAWEALRQLPEAAAIGMAIPRFLVRLPYGKETDPIESFSFEEMPEKPEHEDYLWGNPAFVCALLLAESFTESGWELNPGQRGNLDRLPVHVYRNDGESEMKPCAETLMTVATAERIMESGIMPLASIKGKDEVRVVRFQSVAKPVRALAGRWNQ